MTLEFRNGSKRFYARFKVGGKRHTIPLKTPVAGVPPERLSMAGDPEFERSRAKAEVEAEGHQSALKNRQSAAAVLQKIYEIQEGKPLQNVQLSDLKQRWRTRLRKRPLSEHHQVTVCKYIDDFVSFVKSTYPKTSDAAAVDSSVAAEFMHTVEQRGVATKTWNHVRSAIASVFETLVEDDLMSKNPFRKLPIKEGSFVGRKPFSIDELSLIFKHAKDDEYLRPLITIAACTALRLGDCCLLQWDQVDFDIGFHICRPA